MLRKDTLGMRPRHLLVLLNLLGSRGGDAFGLAPSGHPHNHAKSIEVQPPGRIRAVLALVNGKSRCSPVTWWASQEKTTARLYPSGCRTPTSMVSQKIPLLESRGGIDSKRLSRSGGREVSSRKMRPNVPADPQMRSTGGKSGLDHILKPKWVGRAGLGSGWVRVRGGSWDGHQGRDSGNGNGGGGGSGGKGNGGADRSAFTSSGGNNSTMIDSRGTSAFYRDSNIEIDSGTVARSPLVRTLAPVVKFFRSRAGLYGMMLGYVAFTLSQHITPAFLAVSFLTLIGPKPARAILVFGAQALTVLTVASYVQDQFQHLVYPLPAVVAGPSAPYAVITGGSSGIGKEIANELAGRGYNLLLVSRGKEELNRTAKELMETSREMVEAAKREHEAGTTGGTRRGGRRRGKKRFWGKREEVKKDPQKHRADASSPSEAEGREASAPPPHLGNTITARWFAADLSNTTAAASVFNEVKRLNITVDILVNSAGVCRVGQFDTLEEEDLMAQMQLNVVGTTLISRLFAKEFARQRRGRIMIVSSITAANPNPTVAVYAASKSYLTSFAEALHGELEASGVGVTCVMPGATRTAFEDNSGSASALVWRLPLVCTEADEVAARAVEALMRGDRSLVTGWVNRIYVHAVAPLVPQKIKMSFLKAMWR